MNEFRLRVKEDYSQESAFFHRFLPELQVGCPCQRRLGRAYDYVRKKNFACSRNKSLPVLHITLNLFVLELSTN